MVGLTGVNIRFPDLVKVLLSARMADGRVGLMIVHFEMCLFTEGNGMVIFCWLLGWQDYNRKRKGKNLRELCQSQI